MVVAEAEGAGGVGDEATLQTSGVGAGTGITNDDTVVEFVAVQPDAWGHVYVDVEIDQGGYAYLALLELTVEG